MKVVLSTWGKFHSFHLARQMQRFGWLEAMMTTYPWRALRKEGIPRDKLLLNPWFHAAIILKWRAGLYHTGLDRAWIRSMDIAQQRFIARNIPACDIFIALSGAGLSGGRVTQAQGGKWICDRSSSHILYSDEIMTEEFARFGLRYTRSDPYLVEKEIQEYALADRIVVPSEFARQSFIAKGVAESRLTKIFFGSDLSRFQRTVEPEPGAFTICFCGQLAFRKGIPDLLAAFRLVRHPRKRLIMVGGLRPELKPFLDKADLTDVEILAPVPQPELARIYSRANVFAMASVEEGMAVVQAEAMACGLPVVATFNAGASDVVQDGVNGFITPIRSPEIMAEKLQILADDPDRCRDMGEKARGSIKAMGGWNHYGDMYHQLCQELAPGKV